MKATRLVHQLAGHPVPEGAVNQQITRETAVCCMCGIVEDNTAPADKALGANFTDRTLIANPDSPRVCRACIAICSGKPPRTFRLWTIVATPVGTMHRMLRRWWTNTRSAGRVHQHVYTLVKGDRRKAVQTINAH